MIINVSRPTDVWIILCIIHENRIYLLCTFIWDVLAINSTGSNNMCVFSHQTVREEYLYYTYAGRRSHRTVCRVYARMVHFSLHRMPPTKYYRER